MQVKSAGRHIGREEDNQGLKQESRVLSDSEAEVVIREERARREDPREGGRAGHTSK